MRVFLRLLLLCVALVMPRKGKAAFESRGGAGRLTGTLPRPGEAEVVGVTPANTHKRPRGDADDLEAGSDDTTRGRTKGRSGEHIAHDNNPVGLAAVLANQVLTEKRKGKRKAAGGTYVNETEGSLRSFAGRKRKSGSRGKAAAASATATRGAAAAASACGHGGDDSGSDDEAATRLTAASATPTPAASAKRQRGPQAKRIQAAAQKRANKAVQEVVAQGGSPPQVAFALRELGRAGTRQQVSPAQMTL